MNTRLISLLLTAIVLTVIGLVFSASAERLGEPKGLVTFEMPGEWSNDRFGNGRHYTRDGSSDDPNILAVVPELKDEYMTLETMSKGRKQVNLAQDHRLVSERVHRINGFDVWEAVYEAEIRSQNVVFHTYLMFSDTLMIDVHLNASKDVYKTYLPDLRRLAHSVRAR